MKIVITALMAAALVTLSVQTRPTIDPRSALQSADSTGARIITAQSMPGECCNDDFRQALPRWEAPVGPTVAKP